MPSAAGIYYHAYFGVEEGKRPAVVLIHGAGGSHLYWPSEMRRLAGYRVYALDLPGHGRSGERGQQSISSYVSSVVVWLEATGLHSAVFVGHSMGSAIAISLALDYPEHVLSLGLIGAAARLKVAPALLESTANTATFNNAVQLVVDYSYGPDSPAQLTELAARRLAENRPSVLHGDLMACDTFDETLRIADIQHPTLVVCGSKDRMTSLRHAQFLARSIPGARLEVVPNAGHMVMLENPKAVADALTGFLNEIQY